jgi:hypothetical protein
MGPLCYRRHRFPPEIIQHAIWLYLRFTLSYRDVEELPNASFPDKRNPLKTRRLGYQVEKTLV